MATNLFSQAAAYRKKHPSVSQTEAVKICAKANRSKPGKKKPAAKKKPVARKKTATKKRAAVGTVKRKKAAPKRVGKPAKVKVRVSRKKGTATIRISGISGISMAELERNVLHLQNLEKIHTGTKELLKDKRQKDAFPDLRRQLVKNAAAIAATKKHITALKRTI